MSSSYRALKISDEADETVTGAQMEKLVERLSLNAREAKRRLHIGNPIMRKAVERDAVAARTERQSDFRAVSKQMRDHETERMAKEDRRR